MMAFKSVLVASVLLGSALANPLELAFGRSVGGACKAPEGSGTCQSTSNCKGISYTEPYCPNDPDDVQCCVEQTCSVGSQSGYCRHTSQGCSGTFQAGTGAPWPCPGGDDIQCCVSGGSTPPPTGGDVGSKILAVAQTAAGMPYAYGGGSCQGPSHDEPPWQYGETGYDCSGLVCWSLCKVTGRDLFTEGLRNTHNMYCAAESTLKYQKYPYAQRQVGDAVFFGGACDCSDFESIHHVGLVMDNDGDRMWNAPNDQINKVVEMSISGFGEAPCPYVIRFTG